MRPKTIPDRPPKKRAQVQADVLPQLQVHDDARLPQHSAMWEQTHGERVSLYWLLAASVQKSCCFHHPHVPFFSLFSGKYLELLVKWSLMLADSGTDIPSSQYTVATH